MTKLIMACVDCHQLLDEHSTKRCVAPTIVEGYKGGMHWPICFKANEIPDEYAWMRKFAQVQTTFEI